MNETVEAAAATEADELATNETTTEEAQTPEEAQAEALNKLTKQIARRQRLFHLADEATNSIGWGVWIVAIVVAVLFLIPIALGLTSSVVLTESMTGSINKGDVALTIPFDKNGASLQVGDVALITQGDGSQFLHRITAVNDDGTYSSKGDANSSNDMFKPTDADIDSVLFNVLKQPVSGLLVLFSVNFQWFGSFGQALFSGNWAAVGSLLALAPWGFLILALAAFVFWSLIPRLLQRIINRANLSAAVERERIKQAVDGHDESLTEIEPVIEEIKQEKAEKAEEFAFAAAAQESLLATITQFDDPEKMWADLYDEDELPAVDPTPTPVNPFAALAARRENTAQNAPARSLGEFPPFNEQSHASQPTERRASASAFDLSDD